MITPARPEHWPEIRRICVATAYSPVADPEAFAEKWIGPYQRNPELSFVALEQGRVAGYVVGALETPDAPPGYPAHLHINVDPRMQGKGLGRKLIEAFAGRCPLPVHVVCGDGPVKFYLSVGFEPLEMRGKLHVLGLASRPDRG